MSRNSDRHGSLVVAESIRRIVLGRNNGGGARMCSGSFHRWADGRSGVSCILVQAGNLRTVSLSQLIHRGIMMLVKVIAQAGRGVSQSKLLWNMAINPTSHKGHQGSIVDQLSSHFGSVCQSANLSASQ